MAEIKTQTTVLLKHLHKTERNTIILDLILPLKQLIHSEIGKISFKYRKKIN